MFQPIKLLQERRINYFQFFSTNQACLFMFQPIKLLQERRINFLRIFILVHKDKRRASRTERRGVVALLRHVLEITGLTYGFTPHQNASVNRHSKHHNVEANGRMERNIGAFQTSVLDVSGQLL
jgi:hypothetical protein